MPGVVAALKAHHNVRLRREVVHKAALALVPPLHTDQYHRFHTRAPFRPPPAQFAARRMPIVKSNRDELAAYISIPRISRATTTPVTDACINPRVIPAPSPMAYRPFTAVINLSLTASFEE